MADRDSDSDDNVKFEWESDGEAEPSSAPAFRNSDAPGPSTLDCNGRANEEVPSTALIEEYVAMGFPKEIVVKGMKEIGHSDADALLELILTYQALGADDAVGNCSTSGCAPQSVEEVDDDDDLDFENWDGDDDDVGGRGTNCDDPGDEDFLQEMSQKDKKINSLVGMGFAEDEANIAIRRCGVDADLCVLVDSISASLVAGDFNSRNISDHQVMDRCFDSFGGRKKARLMEESKKRRMQYAQGSGPSFAGSHDEPTRIPDPMVGFNLPSDRKPSMTRMLPEQAIGPPFFYFQNVARAPRGAWTTISKKFYDIQPEFVDSKYFCAASRESGYIHNLPIENREALLPFPPKTVFDAFPHYKKWWPSWDPRRQLNCLQASVATAKFTDQIQRALARSGNPSVQKHVVDECKTWDLVWVGKNKVAQLEPDEMESLLGFPRDHTRGIVKTERYRSLANSFQVDTVAYHLSVLRDMFPNGVNVLSLSTGIGGGVVALHRLGIRMRTVVSVEKGETNRRVFNGWWDQTHQTGKLVEIADLKSLTNERIASLVGRFGGFDLVIGGSQGEQSALLYDYPRILDAIKSAMARM
ncbi:DNA (cytosine-5)-methyltransferase DRM2-like [Triticum dicoccoides]|uniref:DNA (cytosine-5)-methyltransferase DRM2-like n=1 Tax=Triticum dicoccoides TaxID=85692 RepID=UPI001891CDE6|nr:DNA (cytosine-5)-methyltransferase DRM2-like [Triticum dicoccoides]